jgi:glycosyltransferase involved in cell wall biosynthesis
MRKSRDILACLVLFFTRGVSLKTWDTIGMFEREVALYRRLQEHGVQVGFVTYGDASDLAYAGRLPGIRILCNRWGLPERLYICLVSWLYPLLWPGPAVFKSNQVAGADVALQAARRFGKKFIVRCGYLPSEFRAFQHGLDSAEVQRAMNLERALFTAANRVVVTTPAMQQTVLSRYKVDKRKVTVIPNYVDINLFQPGLNSSHQPGRLCFVGRLEEQKNPFAMLEAIKGLDVELLVVGNGSLGELLQTEASANGLPVRFLGNVPHRQLPEILNSAKIFVLPSHYEGHPKTLLEAMACGLPVIGSDVPGIRELIRHRETGYLCGTSSGEIRAAIKEVLADADLSVRMGRNAREFAVEHFSLDRIVQLELTLLREVVT